MRHGAQLPDIPKAHDRLTIPFQRLLIMPELALQVSEAALIEKDIEIRVHTLINENRLLEEGASLLILAA